VEARIFDRLFLKINPDDVDDDQDFTANVNPDSIKVIENCYVEPFIDHASVGDRFQFERQGYFYVDPDSSTGRLVFNRTASLKDTWSKIQKNQI
jgi:glutaminyl-tRNA synthetase